MNSIICIVHCMDLIILFLNYLKVYMKYIFYIDLIKNILHWFQLLKKLFIYIYIYIYILYYIVEIIVYFKFLLIIYMI